MVDYTEKYKSILQKGVSVFDELIQVYAPDKRTTKNWADITVSEATAQRNSLLERFANPKLTSAYTSAPVSSLGHFLDAHWGDYLPDSPKPDASKRSVMENLRADLELVMNDIIAVHNSFTK